MKTLSDKLYEKLSIRDVRPLIDLLELYDAEKDIAKSYSAFAYLSCMGAGGSQALAEAMAEVIEGFYMATSIHDDVLDKEDQFVKNNRSVVSPNSYMVLGDCFFAKIAASFARATPMISAANVELTISRFEQYLMDTAESQIADEQSHGRVPTREAAIGQMKLHGGTWGRLSMEVPALAGGLSEIEASKLGDAGESLFLGLTVRDDLRDLRDDLSNNVLTLAPAIFLEAYDGKAAEFCQPIEPLHYEALINLLGSDGAINQTLTCGRNYTTAALAQLGDFLKDKEGMNWFLLQMVFRLTNKRMQEFTGDDVRSGQLGIGFSELNEVLDVQAPS